MRSGTTLYLIGTATGVLLVEQVQASDTVTYTYDPLGRLVAVSTSGGPNNGQAVSTSYDPAGNRSTYSVTGAGGTPPPPSPPPPSPPPPPPPSPPPPPPPGNQPPVAVNDSGSMTKCVAKTFAVLANDSDPDNNLPLSLVSASGGGARGTPSIQGTSILFTPNGITGTANVSYTMQDSLGATASATLTISITSGTCGNQAPLSQPAGPPPAPPPPDSGKGGGQ